MTQDWGYLFQPPHVTFTKVRILYMSMDVADGHLAIAFTDGTNILIQRSDAAELCNLIKECQEDAFYRDQKIADGEQRDAKVVISTL